MNLNYHYWYFKGALTPKFCDDLIKYGNQQRELLAVTGSLSKKDSISDKEIKDLKKKRDSNIVWLDDNWIYKEIHPYIHKANSSAGWNFDWGWSESCQFTKYKLNQFYDWHCDSFEHPYNTPNDLNFHGKIRKLSVTCLLSDPKDYEGGDLEFDFRNLEPGKSSIRKCKEISERGSIVVFPSHVWHRVKPVTKGTRYSLVIWSLGYPFK